MANHASAKNLLVPSRFDRLASAGALTFGAALARALSLRNKGEEQ